MNIEKRLREIMVRNFNKYQGSMTMEEVMQIADVLGKVIVRLIDEDNNKLNNEKEVAK